MQAAHRLGMCVPIHLKAIFRLGRVLSSFVQHPKKLQAGRAQSHPRHPRLLRHLSQFLTPQVAVLVQSPITPQEAQRTHHVRAVIQTVTLRDLTVSVPQTVPQANTTVQQSQLLQLVTA
jgi:hypothetical protein